MTKSKRDKRSLEKFI